MRLRVDRAGRTLAGARVTSFILPRGERVFHGFCTSAQRPRSPHVSPVGRGFGAIGFGALGRCGPGECLGGNPEVKTIATPRIVRLRKFRLERYRIQSWRTGCVQEAEPSRPGLAWHHAPEPGAIRLIPAVEHWAPGPVQSSLCAIRIFLHCLGRESVEDCRTGKRHSRTLVVSETPNIYR